MIDRLLFSVASAFAHFVIDLKPEGGRWEIPDLLPGRIVVEVRRTEKAKIQVREWTEIKEPVAV